MQQLWDWAPTWQNSINTVSRSKDVLVSIGVYDVNELVTYVIYNPLSKRVPQFAVDNAYRNKSMGRCLFAYIARNFDAENFVNNVDHNSKNTAMFLEPLGLNKYIQQYEMCMDIP
ncbi:MAG: hypothetical protein LBL90_09780 [Prevotellaceae bacterium]|jgi:hypothetical protein|nr:hypothetical protein [Prevotellaceae bacterium]